eukprot:10080130-Prorocentrum_lima.AAC.1
MQGWYPSDCMGEYLPTMLMQLFAVTVTVRSFCGSKAAQYILVFTEHSSELPEPFLSMTFLSD